MKLYAIFAVVLLALAGGLKYYWQKAHDEHEKVVSLEVTIAVERENTRIADASATRYAARIQGLRNAPHSPLPKLMCSIPKPVRVAPTAPGADAAQPPDDPGVSEPTDIEPRLAVSYSACEENLIKLEELQRWVHEALQAPRRIR